MEYIEPDYGIFQKKKKRIDVASELAGSKQRKTRQSSLNCGLL